MFSFLRTIHIDRLSFWLGFLAATLFWWIARNLRGYIPILRKYIKDRIELYRERRLAGLDGRLRRDTIRRAQGMHLAWSLFSLDEILVEPRLLAPPAHVEPGGVQPPDEILVSTISYLPDWTELPARFNAATLGLEDCLAGGANLAIIGQAGAGKTVTLATFATRISRREIKSAGLEKYFPIYFHIADLNINEQGQSDPVAPLIDIYTRISPVVILSQIPGFIRSTLNSGNVILIVDGLDELPASQRKSVIDYFAVLMKTYSRLKWIVSASDDHLEGLTALGFVPVSVAAWSDTQYVHFTEKWSKLWMEIILPNIIHQEPSLAPEPALLNSWLLSENIHRSPFEFTLKVWSAYAHFPRGPRPVDAIEAYLHQLAPQPKSRLALERLAVQMVTTSQVTINRGKAGSLVAEFELTASPSSENSEEELISVNPAASAPEPETVSPTAVETPKVASLSRILPELIDNGLIVERQNENLGFAHPIILGYLSGCALQQGGNLTALVSQPAWTGKDLALRYLASRGNVSNLVGSYLQDLEEPLYSRLFVVARWLKDGPPAAPWRGIIMRKLAEVIQREVLPMSVRQRALAGLISANDPGVGLFFRQLLTSPSASLRQLATIGCGLLQDQKTIPDLCDLLQDPDMKVRYAATLALAGMGTPAGIEAIISQLEKGEEDIRRAVAESLARNSADGHEILKEAAVSEDILVRRAAVFGLIQVDENWANEILDKMRVEDGQWVVRSAAAQALEMAQQLNPRIPHPLPLPSQSPWLITYASKQGEGIPPGSEATDLMVDALKKGTEEEKLAALDYLKNRPDKDVIGAIMVAAYTESEAVREAAGNALWWISVSGATIPSPKQFGLN